MLQSLLTTGVGLFKQPSKPTRIYNDEAISISVQRSVLPHTRSRLYRRREQEMINRERYIAYDNMNDDRYEMTLEECQEIEDQLEREQEGEETI